MTPDEIERLATQHLPEPFLKGLLHTVFVAHDAAWKYTYSEFATTEAVNIVGFNRRAKLEGGLRDLAVRFPGIEATVVRSDSPWFHTEVRSGPVV